MKSLSENSDIITNKLRLEHNEQTLTLQNSINELTKQMYDKSKEEIGYKEKIEHLNIKIKDMQLLVERQNEEIEEKNKSENEMSETLDMINKILVEKEETISKLR